MPWFKVDDRAFAHPKLRAASKAALGLWLMGGSYAASFLTDGRVHGRWVKENNATPKQLATLTELGLWHAAGHDCPRCPQPAEGDYQIHDFLTYNRSRAQAEEEREKAAEKKRRQRGAGEPSEDLGKNVAHSSEDLGKSWPNSWEDLGKNAERNSDSSAGQPPMSPGESPGSHARASRPGPTRPVVSPTEIQARHAGAREGAGNPLPATFDRAPEYARSLRDRLTAAGIVLRWDLTSAEWLQLDAMLKRSGEDMLAGEAVRTAQRKEIHSVRYLLRVWSDLPPAPAAGTVPAAAAANVVDLRSRHQRETDAMFEAAHARARAREEAEDAAREHTSSPAPTRPLLGPYVRGELA